MTEQAIVSKRVAIIPFPGGRIEIRNASDYPERDRTTGEPTGRMLKARPGTFLCLPNSDALDVSSIPLDEVLHPGLVAKISGNKLAKSILRENDEASLKTA